jgi:hypothetical protein
MAGTFRTPLIFGNHFAALEVGLLTAGHSPFPRPLKAPVKPALHRGLFSFRRSPQFRQLGDVGGDAARFVAGQ